jgi:plastocyanin
LAVVLGAAVVVLPAVAGSEASPTINAVSEGLYKEQHRFWQPSQATVGAGGMVTFANNSGTVEHGVVWSGGPTTPTCEAGVPVNKGGTNWKGSCTFSQAGTYAFYCYVHPTEMTGTITVNPNGTTTTTTTSSSTTTTTTTSTQQGTSTTNAQSGSPLAGSLVSALKLPALQHGSSVHGSIQVSQAGLGGRLEVALLAKRASLASPRHPAQVRVGRLVRTSLPAGTISFTVALSSKAKRALRAHHHLALSVKILLTSASGSAAVTITRGVVVRR